MHPLPISIRACAAALATLASVSAQADLHWKTGVVAPGPLGLVYTSTSWDPDGAGPRTPVLVVGGGITMASIGAQNVAAYDPASGRWTAFAGQPNGTVHAIAVLADERLAIGGTFSMVGNVQTGQVAVWNGDTWSSLGATITGVPFPAIRAMQVLPNGDLVVGGDITQIAGIAATGVARWNGSQWSSLGLGNRVDFLAQRPNGHLVAAGTFPGNVAEWNGSTWTVCGPGLSTYWINALTIMPNGDVIVVPTGGPNETVRWDGTSWSILSTGILGYPKALLPLANGDLLAAPVTSINQVPVNGIARWDGQQWTPYLSPIGLVYTMQHLSDGTLVVAGTPSSPSGEVVRGAAAWDGTAWRGLGRGFDDTVRGLQPLDDGSLLAYGSFQSAEGTVTGPMARWNGQTWSTHPPVSPTCSTVDPDGNVWVAIQSGGSSGPGNILRWTGTAWQATGTAIGSVEALLVDANQQPIVGCRSYPGYGPRTSQWTGSQWTVLGQDVDGPVTCLLRRANGDLIAGGEFLFSGSTPVSRIARFDGANWQPMGSGFDGPVHSLVELPNGDLVAAGSFITDGSLLRPLNLVARWDGTEWQPMHEGLAGGPGCSVRTLLVLPGGDLLAGGDFLEADGRPARGIARWNGTDWSAVDIGVDGTVLALAQTRSGEIFAGGNFAMAGGRPSAHFARLRTTFPAAVAAYGNGCNGPLGPITLTALGLPWLGSTYRATCGAVAPTSFGVGLLGLATADVPLAAIFPVAASSCTLLVAPDVVTLHLPTASTIPVSISLPRVAVLMGLDLHHQVLVGEIDASSALTFVGSSDATTLRLGSF